MIVIPASLQMGWTSSPPFFCAATETGRDIAELLRTVATLPPHEMEDGMITPAEPGLITLVQHPTTWEEDSFAQRRQDFEYLFEVFVDDYIACVQSTDEEVLRHHSRALLHAIHEIFPRPRDTGDAGEDPISQKKLLQDKEGVWAVRQEILGWVMDGLHRTIQLPEKKVGRINDMITVALRNRHCQSTEFQSLVGKLTHAAMGIPAGKVLLQPLYRIMHFAH